MGGVYLDGDSLKFNPFANILDDANFDLSAERIRDQMSVMASPNGNLDEVHEGLLLQAVQAAWLSKRNKARIDDVVDFLKTAKESQEYAESPTIRSRLDEMIILLDQYTVNGIYGDTSTPMNRHCTMMPGWWSSNSAVLNRVLLCWLR
jgi:conjugal transfer ATP-binding protein TraC